MRVGVAEVEVGEGGRKVAGVMVRWVEMTVAPPLQVSGVFDLLRPVTVTCLIYRSG